jgi:hypothetical protein
MKILKDSFEKEFKDLSDKLAREHYEDSEEEMEEYMFKHQTKFTDFVDLEKELANIESFTFLKNKENKVSLAGQNIEFVSKTGTTLTPTLHGITLKGSLKKKFLATLGFGTDTEEVEMWNKYWTKQTFQYGTIVLAYFMEDWTLNKGFFMRVDTSKINRTTRKRVYSGERFAYKTEEEEQVAILIDENETLKEEVYALTIELENLKGNLV